MSESEILPEIQTILDNLFLAKVVATRELSASSVGEWDSIRHTQFILLVEIAFSIRFRTGEIWGVSNLGDLVDIIAKRTNDHGPRK